MTLTPCLVLALLAPAADAPANPHNENFLFQELQTKGLPVGAGETYKFPTPLMPDGLTADQQKAALAALAKGVGSVKEICNTDTAAPFYFKQSAVKPSDPQAPAYALNVWFVAHGNFDKLIADNDPQQLFATNPANAKVTPLKPAALKDRDITVRFTQMPLMERYSHTESLLLNEVKVWMTSHTVVSKSDESLVVASQLDPSFAQDKEFPNAWKTVKSPTRPKVKEGPLEAGGFYLSRKARCSWSSTRSTRNRRRGSTAKGSSAPRSRCGPRKRS
jgi:hypothetical protein